MENIFFNFVRDQIKSIPCSVSLGVEPLIIGEEEFLKFLKQKYDIYLLYFNKNSFFNNVDYEIINNEKYIGVEEKISYYLKLNNQLFFEYIVYNKNKNFAVNSDDYYISSINIYSSNTHKEELIKILGFINEYITKNKIK